MAHERLKKALKEALRELDSVGDRAIRENLLGLVDDPLSQGLEEELPEELEDAPMDGAVAVTVEKVGKPLKGSELEVVEGEDGMPVLDETEATPEEEEITDELMAKLIEALGK